MTDEELKIHLDTCYSRHATDPCVIYNIPELNDNQLSIMTEWCNTNNIKKISLRANKVNSEKAKILLDLLTLEKLYIYKDTFEEEAKEILNNSKFSIYKSSHTYAELHEN